VAQAQHPKGVIYLASALAFHQLTDQIPPKVWMAIGPKEWRPRFRYPPVRFARFPETQLRSDVEHHRIDGVRVPIFGVAKTITDLFRYRRTVGINLALEGLREALRNRKATPAEIANRAVKSGVWKTMEPYMNALRADG
jgi:predicted transcriptional regulator of viral defense system